MSTGQLAGKSAVITGSTSGVGEGIARAFAKAGANIMLNGFGEAAAIEKLRTDIESTHGIHRENVIRDVLLAPQPNKRFVAVDEVASLALCLASNAAVAIIGASLSIDGDWTAR